MSEAIHKSHNVSKSMVISSYYRQCIGEVVSNREDGRKARLQRNLYRDK